MQTATTDTRIASPADLPSPGGEDPEEPGDDKVDSSLLSGLGNSAASMYGSSYEVMKYLKPDGMPNRRKQLLESITDEDL